MHLDWERITGSLEAPECATGGPKVRPSAQQTRIRVLVSIHTRRKHRVTQERWLYRVDLPCRHHSRGYHDRRTDGNIPAIECATVSEATMVSARLVNLAAALAAQCPMPLDRLPYTEEFEAIYAEFVAAVGADYSRHDCWWYLPDARKRGLVGASRRARGSKKTAP